MKRIVIYYCASSGVDMYLYQKCKNPFLLQYSYFSFSQMKLAIVLKGQVDVKYRDGCTNLEVFYLH